jgi:hypothetical protein
MTAMRSTHRTVLLVAALLLASTALHAQESRGAPGTIVGFGADAPVSRARTERRCRTAGGEADWAAGDAGSGERGVRAVYEDTLWIFDADFEDLLGDNAGWTTADMSGTLEHTNYWHHDTIRLTEPYLGTSTWWCGTVDTTGCWKQPRGYGNNWISILERELPLSEWSEPGDEVVLEWDQRYAMERNYDYGYVDVSTDGGTSWSTIATYNNKGFQGAGLGADWDDHNYGHPAWDLSTFADTDIRLRYRFESDSAYSSEDQYDNPQHSVKDGAWQLDNITITVNGDIFFYDDSESGNMGWMHDDIPATGQTGHVFRRSYEDLWFLFGPCRHHKGWMMVAYDSLTGVMVDGQNSWLVSPPIDIAGAPKLLGLCEAGIHIEYTSTDRAECWFAASDVPGCGEFQVSDWSWPEWEINDPLWVTEDLDLDTYAGDDWLSMRWVASNRDRPPPWVSHQFGILLDRVRIGIPVGNATVFEPNIWDSFFDTFDVEEALAETASVRIRDDDGIVEAYLMASEAGGGAWSSYEMIRIEPGGEYWLVPPPMNEIAPATEVRYYYESTDGLGNTRTYPKDAPDESLEFSILPIVASLEHPGILLVDKHGQLVPNEHREFTNTSEDYYREALDLLGLEYDVYDVRVPSGSIHSEGPDTSGMKYYDTQIWFAGDYYAYSLWPSDQWHLIQWLSEAAAGEERNFLLTGNDVGYYLEQAGGDTLDFYSVWLASDYVADYFSTLYDTMPTLRDAEGDFDFMTYDDRECLLWNDGYG